MKTPRDILADLSALAGGDLAALNSVTLTGTDPCCRRRFASMPPRKPRSRPAGLAAAEIWKQRSGQSQNVTVDMVHATAECRSERYLRVDSKPPPPTWDPTAGIYTTRDKRFVRLHTNFRHHRATVCNVLGCDRSARKSRPRSINGTARRSRPPPMPVARWCR